MTDVVVSGQSVECNVSGSMEPLVAALAAAGVEHMTTREVSLEELFVSQYGAGDERGDAGFMKHAEVAIARRALRQLWVSAAVCTLAFGATVAASAVSYVSSFPTQASRDLLVATTGHDAGLTVLLGPISAIGTVGGYTFYKVFLFLTTIGALWGLLAATRLLRGEEDAGRWQLTLAGNTRPDRATGGDDGRYRRCDRHRLLGTVLLTLLAGRKEAVAFGAGETVLFGLSMVIPLQSSSVWAR